MFNAQALHICFTHQVGILINVGYFFITVHMCLYYGHAYVGFFLVCLQSTVLPATYHPRYHWGELLSFVIGLNVESDVESFLKTY